MSKNNKSDLEVNVSTPENVDENAKTYSVKSVKKQQQQDAKPKKSSENKKGSRFGRMFKSIGRKLKETMSELKKVSWPTFPKVVRQTGIVIALVIFFTLVLFGIDRLLSMLYTLLL